MGWKAGFPCKRKILGENLEARNGSPRIIGKMIRCASLKNACQIPKFNNKKILKIVNYIDLVGKRCYYRVEKYT